jgi:pimeloyl-ACP methyl ester carboxylesterase
MRCGVLRPLVVPLLAVLVTLAGACAGGRTSGSARQPAGSPASASAPASPTGVASSGPVPAGARCAGQAAGGVQVRFPDGRGPVLAGLLLGTGRTGVVLAHQARGDVCQWLSYGLELAGRGYRVLVFDFAGAGASGGAPGGVPVEVDVMAAVGYLRQQNVARVVLIGASMGANACLVAATRITPAVAGVVSLSAPAFYQGTDARSAVRGLAVPVLYVAGAREQGFGEDARTLYATTPAATARTILLPDTADHGVDLIRGGGAAVPAVRAAVDAFLASRAPA